MYHDPERTSGVSPASADEVVNEAARLNMRREAVFVAMAYWRAWAVDFGRHGVGLDPEASGETLLPKNRAARLARGGVLRVHEQSKAVHVPPGALHIGGAADLHVSHTRTGARPGWLSSRQRPPVNDVAIAHASAAGGRQDVLTAINASDYDLAKRHLGEIARKVEIFSSVLSTMVDVYNIDCQGVEYRFPMLDADHPDIEAHRLDRHQP